VLIAIDTDAQRYACIPTRTALAEARAEGLFHAEMKTLRRVMPTQHFHQSDPFRPWPSTGLPAYLGPGTASASADIENCEGPNNDERLSNFRSTPRRLQASTTPSRRTESQTLKRKWLAPW
jgi:hypothetical protein